VSEEATGERTPLLRPGESVCERLVANHVRDRRPYDGYLYVTTERLVWVPWPLAQTQGALSFDIPLPEVRVADVAERGSTGASGGMTSRCETGCGYQGCPDRLSCSLYGIHKRPPIWWSKPGRALRNPSAGACGKQLTYVRVSLHVRRTL
jgi:hypothetical protein